MYDINNTMATNYTFDFTKIDVVVKLHTSTMNKWMMTFNTDDDKFYYRSFYFSMTKDGKCHLRVVDDNNCDDKPEYDADIPISLYREAVIAAKKIVC